MGVISGGSSVGTEVQGVPGFEVLEDLGGSHGLEGGGDVNKVVDVDPEVHI